MSAGEPEEVDAYQEIFDDLINAETDYKVEIESVGDFEEQFQIRAEGGTLDVAAVPAAGRDRRRSSTRARSSSLEDLGFDIDELNDTRRRVVRGPRRVRRQALRPADEHQPQEHGLVPEGRLRRRRLQGAEDVRRADRAERPDRRRRQHAVVRRLRERGRDRLAGHRLDGGHHAPHRRARRLRPVGRRTRSRSTTRRSKTPASVFGEIMFTDGYVLGGADGTRRTSPFGDAPVPMFDDPPKCWLHRQASFINALLPGGRRGRRRLRLVPVPADRPGGHPVRAASSPSSARTATGPRSSTSSSGSSPRTCSARWAACRRRRASRRTSNVGPDCYANDILADASVVLTEALKEGTGRFDASDLMPAAVGQRQLLDRDGRVRARTAPTPSTSVLDDIEDELAVLSRDAASTTRERPRRAAAPSRPLRARRTTA